ncbi:Sec-independent protein translocase subunit TatA [Vallicoccus soli]|uniref:Sec-independent protein translocase protein TatA n=1 Tax=Vallicoccus soli TaxID=2339232 RepID=A0A3A3YRA5_9ACTN|nr:Sec-independent protein translocase subunit TatA [Vallicoccus soli]RJK93173.1 Sec-independent protein translocase subunit TatA [Vallicoccus soli]
MPNLGAPELLIILVVLVFLFGAKRLPDMSRSVARSMKIFKTEVKEMREEDKPAHPTQTSQTDQVRYDARPLEGRVESAADRQQQSARQTHGDI